MAEKPVMNGASGERWARADGFPMYEVSDRGRVRSYYPWRDIEIPRLMIQASHDQKGLKYLRVLLRDADGRRKQWYVHRLVLFAFVGPCPEGLEGCHNNGDGSDNRLSNLRWDTQQSNRQDTLSQGRDHHASKTHCIRNHEFSEENTRVRVRGGRTCKACKKIQDAEYRERRRARL